MSERLAVGVVGVGHLGALHAEKYAACGDVQLSAVFDSDAARAATVAARLGCRAASSLADLLATCRAVSIAVPVLAHEEVGRAAIAAGCHVLMEKPLAASLAAGERLLAASRTAEFGGKARWSARSAPRFSARQPQNRATGRTPRFG